MPQWRFGIESAESLPEAIGFRVAVLKTSGEAAPVRSIALNCQVRIEPARRRYSSAEQERLYPLFGDPERWGQTVRGIPWATLTTTIAAFEEETTAELRVPIVAESAAAAYFSALEEGETPLRFLFSGFIFYEAGIGLQAAPIPWDREACYRLPVEVWKQAFAEAALA
ncbi:MAG TPA: DUF6084 family protein [Urbifossiella sp.]|nr:DUF6084 family protein [Urbifossiella sp.]